ncbi:uncharacterized protein LOC142223199 [Haematobia irritans]|uniref:uncharacterized protein LOC142223199 n=1 Tax=Haematobia irritans TaxID=7368 RepID=UPI003F4FC4EF
MFVKIKLEPQTSSESSLQKNTTNQFIPIEEDITFSQLKRKIEPYVNLPPERQIIRAVAESYESRGYMKVHDICKAQNGSSLLMLYAAYDEFCDYESPQFVCFLQIYSHEDGLRQQEMEKQVIKPSHQKMGEQFSKPTSTVSLLDESDSDSNSETGSETESSSSSSDDSNISQSSGEFNRKHKKIFKSPNNPKRLKPTPVMDTPSSTMRKYLDEFPNTNDCQNNNESRNFDCMYETTKKQSMHNTRRNENSSSTSEDEDANDIITRKSVRPLGVENGGNSSSSNVIPGPPQIIRKNLDGVTNSNDYHGESDNTPKKSECVTETTNTPQKDKSLRIQIFQSKENSFPTSEDNEKNNLVATGNISSQNVFSANNQNSPSSTTTEISHPCYKVNPEIRKFIIILSRDSSPISNHSHCEKLLDWFFHRFQQTGTNELKFNNDAVNIFEGKIWICCLNKSAFDWVTSCLHTYSETYNIKSLNEGNLCEVVIPMISSSKKLLDIFDLLEKQNSNLDTSMWSVINRKILSPEEGEKRVSSICTNELFSIHMDDASMMLVKKFNFKLKYCFWQLEFIFK